MKPEMGRYPRIGFSWTLLVAASSILAFVAYASSFPAETKALTLGDAVEVGDVDLARSLLESGADPDSPRVLTLTPLMRAALRDDVEMVALLIASGADIGATDPSGQTAVHVAAQRDAVEALATLVAAGADLHAVSKNGMNVMQYAAAWGSIEVMRAFPDEFDLDAPSGVVTQGHGHPRDTGTTALGIAARDGQFASVETLLQLGADVDAPSAAGHTPLLLAIFAGASPEIVQALLDAGADSTITAECSGECLVESGDALFWAQQLGRSELIPMIARAADSSR